MAKKRIENIKTFVLVVLFIATILLLYFLWNRRTTARSFKLSDVIAGANSVTVPEIGEVLLPSHVAYCDGHNRFVLFEDENIIEEIASRMREANGNSGSVTEIGKSLYKYAVSSSKSLLVSFDYGIPFSEFCDHYGIKRIANAADVGDFRSLAFSSYYPESLLVENTDGKFFRIMEEQNMDIIEYAQTKETGAAGNYYFAEDIFGGDNRTLIPLIEESYLQIQFMTVEDSSDTQLRRSLARSVFGENLDFVRRISDDFGNITYLYSSGQKSFTAYMEGGFEYKSAAKGTYGRGFFNDLETALEFGASCGGWSDSSQQECAYYLGFCSRIDGGYRFCFYQDCCAKTAVEIDVQYGQVSYFTRDIVNGSGGIASAARETSDATNIIAGNCDYIYNTMHGLKLAVDSDDALNYVVENLVSIVPGHYRSTLENALLPAWAVKMSDGSIFYFGLYNGIPMGSENQGAL